MKATTVMLDVFNGHIQGVLDAKAHENPEECRAWCFDRILEALEGAHDCKATLAWFEDDYGCPCIRIESEPMPGQKNETIMQSIFEEEQQ